MSDKLPWPKIWRWSNERDLHGSWQEGHDYSLSGSENGPYNAYAVHRQEAERFYGLQQENDALKEKVRVYERVLRRFATPGNWQYNGQKADMMPIHMFVTWDKKGGFEALNSPYNVAARFLPENFENLYNKGDEPHQEGRRYIEKREKK